MKYSQVCKESYNSKYTGTIDAYLSGSRIVMVESIDGDLLVMTSNGIKKAQLSYEFDGVVIKSDIAEYRVGEIYRFNSNYFIVVDCEMEIKPIAKRKDRGWSVNDYKDKTRIKPKTIQDIRDDKLTKIGI